MGSRRKGKRKEITSTVINGKKLSWVGGKERRADFGMVEGLALSKEGRAVADPKWVDTLTDPGIHDADFEDDRITFVAMSGPIRSSGIFIYGFAGMHPGRVIRSAEEIHGQRFTDELHLPKELSVMFRMAYVPARDLDVTVERDRMVVQVTSAERATLFPFGDFRTSTDFFGKKTGEMLGPCIPGAEHIGRDIVIVHPESLGPRDNGWFGSAVHDGDRSAVNLSVPRREGSTLIEVGDM